jgi:hypothetical protein
VRRSVYRLSTDRKCTPWQKGGGFYFGAIRIAVAPSNAIVLIGLISVFIGDGAKADVFSAVQNVRLWPIASFRGNAANGR